MCKFKFIPTNIENLVVIEPKVFADKRGYFMEVYNQYEFSAHGINISFIQDNQSKSRKGVLRGIHFQRNSPQGKLVRVISGEIFDVAVDLRPKSDTFGDWYGLILSGDNKKQLYIPEGFGHGFLVLSDEAEMLYKCTNFYNPKDEGGLRWDDPEIGIKWMIEKGDKIILSEKDEEWPNFVNLIL
jgi:dTDP-4-dehydrorhamnose 3,5-epimerase